MNYYGTGRSNYFRVKDVEAFAAFIEPLPLTLLPSNVEGMFALICENDDGRLPDCLWNDEGEQVEFDFVGEMKKHLDDDQVFVHIDAGSEGHRYIDGSATAFDNTDAPEAYISLNDIYDRAANAFGKPVTGAEY